MLLGTVTSEKFDEKGNSYWDCWTITCASSVGISSVSSVVVFVVVATFVMMIR